MIKNTGGQGVYLRAINTVGNAVTADISAQISKDGASAAAVTAAGTHIGGGIWWFALSESETNADMIAVWAESTASPLDHLILDPVVIATIDATVGSRSTHSAGDVWSVAEREVTNMRGTDNALLAANVPTNFSSLGINASGHVERVTLVDTTTSNTDMRGTDDAPTAAQIRTEMDNESVQLAKIDALDSEVVTALQSTVAEQVRVALENGKVTVALQDPMDESSPLVYTYYAPNGTTAVVRHTVPQDQSGRTIEVLV